MQSTINEYSYGSRFVLITKSHLSTGNELYIDELGKKLIVSSDSFISSLRENDVIYIYNYGKVARVYEAESRNIDLMLTIHCNSNCIMCPISEGSRQSEEDGYFEYLNALIDILPSNVEHICITGGEPTLLRDNLFIIIEKLARKYPFAEYQMLTNGRSCGNLSCARKLLIRYHIIHFMGYHYMQAMKICMKQYLRWKVVMSKLFKEYEI